MLYHAPDLDRGASELRRVVKPGGIALVVTNGRQHLKHLVDQLSEATGTQAPVRVVDRFTLENGLPLLERHFEHVQLDHLRGALVVPGVAPVVRYAESCRALYETQLPRGVSWSDSIKRFTVLVEREVAENGAWRCVTHSGVFVCR
jgi:SAM-dependent methyltransferase